MIEISEQATQIAQILDDKQAEDILVLKVREMTVIADYFIIASAASTTHVKTLSEEIQRRLSEDEDLQPVRVEGAQEGQWIVLDYGDVLVHLFHREQREFYQLERLWKLEDNYYEVGKQKAAE